MAKQWYIVHTFSGFEQKTKAALEERVKQLGKQDLFGEILVPMEKVVELVKGKKKTSSRKFFPGYILVQMELNDDTWHVVKETPKVTGFAGVTMPICAWVAALKALQNSIILTPRWPSAGPTGGLGFAWPAGICNLISPMTFLAIAFDPSNQISCVRPGQTPAQQASPAQIC